MAARVGANLDRTAHRTFQWVNLALCILFLLFAPLDAISQPPHVRGFVPFLDVGIAAIYLTLFFLFRQGAVKPEQANAVGFITVMIGVLNGFLLVLLTNDPLQTLSFLLVALASAVLFLSWPWFWGSVLAANGAMVVVASLHGWTAMWVQYEIAVMAATGIGIIGHLVRYRTLHQLETLRAQDEEQKALLTDVAERARKAELATREAVERLLENERLRTVNHLRSSFINAISHELNTPLTPLMLQVQMLKNTRSAKEDPNVREAVPMIERNLERMKVLIDQMVSAARLQSGLVELRMQDLEAATSVRETSRRWTPRFDAAGVTLKVDVASSLRVRGDAARLQQILDEVLANALRFTPSGGSVTIGVTRIGRDAEVTIRDTGSGIDERTLKRLGHPFAGLGSESQTGRVGLGLYLTRLLVELHGGQFSLESEGSAAGTTVRFTLPLAETEMP